MYAIPYTKSRSHFYQVANNRKCKYHGKDTEVDGLNLNIALVMNLRVFSAQMCTMNVSRLFIRATQLVNIPRYWDGLVRSTFNTGF